MKARVIFEFQALQMSDFSDEGVRVRILSEGFLVNIPGGAQVVLLLSENAFGIERKVGGVVCAEGQRCESPANQKAHGEILNHFSILVSGGKWK